MNGIPGPETYGPFLLALFAGLFRATDIGASILARTTSGGNTHAR
jgi:hypothetical protein